MTDEKVAELQFQVDNLIVLLNMAMDGKIDPSTYTAMLMAAGIRQCTSCRHCLTASQMDATICRKCKQ